MPKRRLAAIMFTDIVGYTWLMGNDEQKAIELLQRNRTIHKRYIKRYGGELLKEIGDGMLVSFPTTSDAVYCAGAIQKAALEIEGLSLRIGIHQGEVLVDKNDIYGDGVNIASRIEGLAQPNEILVSEPVYNNLKNRTGIEGDFAGEHRLKNVDRPVKVYSLTIDQFPDVTAIKKFKLNKGILSAISLGLVLIITLIILNLFKRDGVSTSQSTIKTVENEIENTIAVLAFKDMSPNKDQEYFSEGIAEEILVQLSKVKEMKVIARTTSFSYKNKQIPIRTMGQEMGADIIVEGSVRKEENIVIISIALIDASNETQLWAKSFEEELKNTMEIQRDIARIISQRLKPEIPLIDINNSIIQSTQDFEAYDLYLKAKSENLKGNLTKSNDFLKESLDLDTSFAEAYALKAWNYTLLAIYWNEINQEEAYHNSLEAVQKSLKLSPDNSESHLILGTIKWFLEWDFKGAERQFEKAIGVGLWPESPTSFCFCGYIHLLISSGKLERASTLLSNVRQIDPKYYYYYSDLGLIHLHQNKWSEAETNFKDGIKVHNYGFIYRLLGILYVLEEQYVKAIETLEESIIISGRDPRTIAILAVAFYHSGQQNEYATIIDELERRSKGKEKRTEYGLALLNAGIGKDQTAIDWLEKAYLEKEIEFVWLNVEPLFKHLHTQERFKNLLRKVGFPD